MAIMCLTGAFPVYASETSQVAIELDAETDGAIFSRINSRIQADA